LIHRAAAFVKVVTRNHLKESMSTPAQFFSNDSYYIYDTNLNVYLDFADGANGTNLTTWNYTGGESQQVCLISFAVTILQD
jgi:hypothetical protein